MTEDQSFINEIYGVLKSSIEVEDWISIRELMNEISDYLYQETGEFEDDFVDD